MLRLSRAIPFTVCLLLLLSGTTALRPDESTTLTRFHFGSCNKADKPQPAWDFISSRAAPSTSPPLFVWLGDIVYADVPVVFKYRIPANATGLQHHYTMQKSRNEYSRFVQKTQIMGVYDDHDYGQNDGDRHYDAETRAKSMQLLWDFLDEPETSQRRKQNAVYSAHTFGQYPRRVRVILLDNRTMKDRYNDAVHQDMLGDEQWAWLEAQLRSSEAEITFIGSGLQALGRGDPVIAESWSKMPASQARLLALIADTHTNGVVLLSGDMHFAEINRLNCSGVGYPLYDFTSSGLTHSWDGPIKSTVVESCLMAATRVGDCIYYGHNFGEIDITWAVDGEGNLDRQRTLVHMRAIGAQDNATHFEHTVALSEITAHNDENSNNVPAADDSDSAFNGLAISKEALQRHHIHACARANASQGYSTDCSIFASHCYPYLKQQHTRKYVISHAAVYATAVAGGFTLLVAPVAICWFKDRLPFGIVPWTGLLMSVYATILRFMFSLS